MKMFFLMSFVMGFRKEYMFDMYVVILVKVKKKKLKC